jgi:hypothetical protein
MPDSIDTITLRRPDDWHVHLRDGAMLAAVVPFTARQFARAIVMPNLVPPVTSVPVARAYRERILAALPAGVAFTPLMTCYLTDITDPQEVARGWEEGIFAAVKLYPAHATTNSASGVTDYDRTIPVLERMAELGMPLLVHGEATEPEVDVFDREAVFIERVLDPLRCRLPELRIVLEHITTEEAVDYVASAGRTWRRPSPRITRDQPQCDFRRRDPSASLLSADRQAREASAGIAPRRDFGKPRFFSAPTARRTPLPPRRRLAVVPAYSPPLARSRSTPRSSKKRTPRSSRRLRRAKRPRILSAAGQ